MIQFMLSFLWIGQLVVCSGRNISRGQFTPRALLEAPRSSEAIPNHDGTLALIVSRSYSFGIHDWSGGIYVLNLINHAKPRLVVNSTSAHSPCWLPGCRNDFAYLDVGIGEERSDSSLFMASVDNKKATGTICFTFDGPVDNLEIQTKSSSDPVFVVSGQSQINGSLYNGARSPKARSSARLYKSLFVRHWDRYLTAERNAIFAGSFHLDDRNNCIPNGPIVNPMNRSFLESPVPPFGDGSHFSLSPDGKQLAFVAKAPDLNPANNTASYIYLANISSALEGRPAVKRIHVPGLFGASACPKFSSTGKLLAFVQMAENGYESDRNRLRIYHTETEELCSPIDRWDRSPVALAWSSDDETLSLLAEEHGRVKIFTMSVRFCNAASGRNPDPIPIMESNSTLALTSLAERPGLYLRSTSSLVSPTWYEVVYFASGESSVVLQVDSPSTHFRMEFAGLSRSQVAEIWFQGAMGAQIHAWVTYPPAYSERSGQKYPVALFIHGGPQGAWLDSWSTRWNPAVFASAGFVVVAVNPTGSTGYGQKFVDKIQGQWGGLPYQDLVLAVDYIASQMPALDLDNMVALGASFGGYMINWIQGHELGRRFKALVCHDGVFNTLNQYASDELYFPQHDFLGNIWNSRPNYDKWNPLNYIQNWATPHFVIHSSLDFRLPEASEGLAPFNILQSLGVPSQYLSFPDEGHWVLQPENSLVWHLEVFRWIRHWAGLEKSEEIDHAASTIGFQIQSSN